jgi:hypothetical protein
MPVRMNLVMAKIHARNTDVRLVLALRMVVAAAVMNSAGGALSVLSGNAG